jgi:hypothetical protein
MPRYYINYGNVTIFHLGEVAECVGVETYMRHMVRNAGGSGYKALNK